MPRASFHGDAVPKPLADLTGKAGCAIVDGQRNPHRLATFRDCRCKKSEGEIAEYLTET